MSLDQRLAALREKAAILGIDISDIADDPDAIEMRLASVKKASDSNKDQRGGFYKTATALSTPKPAEIG